MPENTPEDIKVLILPKGNEIVDKVKDNINNFLNPSKINFYDPFLGDFIKVKSVSEVLEELNITKSIFLMIIPISFIFDDPLIHTLSIITLL